MLTTIIWVPGAIGKGLDVNIPAWAPNIDLVSSAEIERLPSAVAAHATATVASALAPHLQGDIVAALADHLDAAIVAALAVHTDADIVAALADHTMAEIAATLAAHTLQTDIAMGGAVTNQLGHSAVPQLETAAGANVNIPDVINVHGGSGTDLTHGPTAVGVAHAVGGAPVAHGGSGTDVVHADGASPLAHTGADPVVAAVPTKVDRDTISLSVALLVGDILSLSYIEEGTRVVP